MLTPKQNLLETIHGGNPDRFVNQYEFIKILTGDPYAQHNPAPKYGEHNVVNAWGVTRSYPEGTPGAFPVHDAAHIVCPDVTEWQKYVKAPNLKFSDAEWEPYLKRAEEVNRDEYYVSPFIAPGIFEQCHYLMEIQNTLINFYEEPEAMADLIKSSAHTCIPQPCSTTMTGAAKSPRSCPRICLPSSTWMPTSRYTAITNPMA